MICHMDDIRDGSWSITRDVNGAGRVRVVAPPYPTRWILVIQVSAYFFHICGYPRVSASIYKII